jgi:exportin-1
MVILKLLSEEIFDFSAEQMTQVKTKTSKPKCAGIFGGLSALSKSWKGTKPSLVKVTLETLFAFFLNCILLIL